MREICIRRPWFEDVIEAAEGGPLQFAVGVDDDGDPVICDLAEAGHLLIGGATGFEKTALLRNMVLSFAKRAAPEEVRLVVIEPKRIDLASFDGLPHLYEPVFTDAIKAANALSWCEKEMWQRKSLLAEAGVDDLDAFNRQAMNRHMKLPRLVVVIDELADLMMSKSRGTGLSICRISQQGHAVGIHLVLATQHVSPKVITGLIRANVRTRVSFAVASESDSRLILDRPGAEQLWMHGEMLLLGPCGREPSHLQVCFASEEQVRDAVEVARGLYEPDPHPEVAKWLYEPDPHPEVTRGTNDLPSVYLLSRSAGMVAAWEDAFEDADNVIAVHGEFARFMDEHPEVDCVVSPANSYGIMDGGYDHAITNYFGHDLMDAVQQKIAHEWLGEQPVGTSISVEHAGMTLIHSPAMRVPSAFVAPMAVYHCMRTALIEAMRCRVETMVVPAFGAGIGMLPFDVVADLMAAAYFQVANPPSKLNWSYATSRQLPDMDR